jgi:antitoxin YokJ
VSQIRELVSRLREDPTCIFAQPVEWVGPTSTVLPGDLREFYQICGGLELFSDALFVWKIVGPHELVPTNPVVIGEQVEDDITSSWMVIARESGDSDALISIDLSANRSGWCYDSNLEVHGLVGDCAILAFSFTELLEQLVGAHGQFVFWESDQFVSKGDAYDAIDRARQ